MNEKKQKILDCALEEFSVHSFENSSLNKIIDHAKASKGTFYHYFDDKLHLYMQVVAGYIDRKKEFLNILNGDSILFNENDSFFNILKKQTHINIKFFQVEPLYYKFSMKIGSENESIKTSIREKFGREFECSIDDLIEIGYLKGEFDTKYPKGLIKNVISHLCSHYYDLLFKEGDKISEKAMEATLTLYFDFMKDGFSNKK